MRKWSLAQVAHSLAIAIICLGVTIARAQASSPIDQAMWVWPSVVDGTPVTDAAGRQTLIQNAALSGVTALYVSVYQSNPSGPQMFAAPILNDLIQQAHAANIKVWAAYGDQSWITFGCSDTDFPVQRIAEIRAYNAANPSFPFDGVVLDVEPTPAPTPTPTPSRIKSLDGGPSAPQLLQLVALYQCLIAKANALPNPLPVAAAINAFWEVPPLPEYKHFYQKVIQLELAQVIVMGYRNSVGSSDCSQPGIACLDGPAITYWENCPTMAIAGCKQSRSGNIIAGLETGDISDPNGSVTFFSIGQTQMNGVASAMLSQFPNGGLGGFAIERYQNAYLSGSTSSQWPSTNPNFPNTFLRQKRSQGAFPKTGAKGKGSE